MRLGGARNGDEALSSNPSKSDLSDGTPLLVRQLLDLLDDSFVLVKVVALELGSYGLAAVSTLATW